jgi:adenosine deaminase
MNPSYFGAGLAIGLAIGIGVAKRNSKMSIYKNILDFCSKKNIKIYSHCDEISVNEFVDYLNLK